MGEFAKNLNGRLMGRYASVKTYGMNGKTEVRLLLFADVTSPVVDSKEMLTRPVV